MGNTKRENETYMVTLVRHVLGKLDLDHDGFITWDEFEASLELKEMQEYFKTVDVDISDAKGLWNLLDVDNDGSIDAEHLLNGCVRLQGPASALGQNMVMRELGRVMRELGCMAKYLEEMNGMLIELAVLPGAADPPACTEKGNGLPKGGKGIQAQPG